MVWSFIGAGLMILTGVAHSVLGERRLIVPILAIDAPIFRTMLARRVIRLAWHLTTIFMVLCAALILWPGVPRGLVETTGWVWLVVGLFDAIATRGKHVGWPLLALAGLATLIGISA